jgi:hypothetical protein
MRALDRICSKRWGAVIQGRICDHGTLKVSIEI